MFPALSPATHIVDDSHDMEVILLVPSRCTSVPDVGVGAEGDVPERMLPWPSPNTHRLDEGHEADSIGLVPSAGVEVHTAGLPAGLVDKVACPCPPPATHRVGGAPVHESANKNIPVGALTGAFHPPPSQSIIRLPSVRAQKEIDVQETDWSGEVESWLGADQLVPL